MPLTDTAIRAAKAGDKPYKLADGQFWKVGARGRRERKARSDCPPVQN